LKRRSVCSSACVDRLNGGQVEVRRAHHRHNLGPSVCSTAIRRRMRERVPVQGVPCRNRDRWGEMVICHIEIFVRQLKSFAGSFSAGTPPSRPEENPAAHSPIFTSTVAGQYPHFTIRCVKITLPARIGQLQRGCRKPFHRLHPAAASTLRQNGPRHPWPRCYPPSQSSTARFASAVASVMSQRGVQP